MVERNATSWILGSLILLAVVLFGIRWSSGILSSGPVFDEQYITVPINNLMQDGWSVKTAIDFQETKGPALIWPYAIVGKLFGGSLNDLRLVSVWCSIISLLILLWIAVRSSLYRFSLFLVALGWLLLPYNIVFSELVMGEISFLLLSLLAVAAFVWGVDSDSSKSLERVSPKLYSSGMRRIIAPTLYGIAIAVALHSRIHVVAVAAGVCFTAYAIQGKQSWPWWVASIIAGLLRIPLWMRWGGLVSPEYQSLHGLGFRIESLAYLAAALVPFVGVFAIEGWRIAKTKSLLITSFVLGALLVFIAMPDLSVPDTIDLVNQSERFQGIAASVVSRISTNHLVQQIALAVLAGVGLAGLAGIWHCKERAYLVCRITFYSVGVGWLLYAVTRGFVFDRFLLTWAFLLPVLWVRVLPKWLLVLQYLGLTCIAAWLTAQWL